MATVHLGRLIGPEGFARTVAIKQLHPQYAKDPDFVAMFLDEARLVARIRHPNVVPTLDVVQTDEDLLLVMDYVAGETLSHVVRHVQSRGDSIPMEIVAAIMSGVLHGLHAAHEARGDSGELLGVVHRDVSPQNVLVGTDGVARVLDFGVAKALGRAGTTRDGQLKGKMAYMSVEQLYGRGVDRRTDIYAASVVLWEALTMQRLFRGESDAEVFGKVLAGRATPPSEVVPTLDKSFDAVVMRGLSIDPEQRYPTAREMARQLERCVGIATPTDVSDWLEVHAAELLKGRAKRVSAIESSSGVLSQAPSAPPPADLHTVVSDVRDTAAPPAPADYPIDVEVATHLPPADPFDAVADEAPTAPPPPLAELDAAPSLPLGAEPARAAEPPLHLEFQPPIPWRTWGAVIGGLGLLVAGLYFVFRTRRRVIVGEPSRCRLGASCGRSPHHTPGGSCRGAGGRDRRR
jgi:serine/threonine protein kinase